MGDARRARHSEEPLQPQFKGTYGVQAFVVSLGFDGKFGGAAKPPTASSNTGTVSKK